MSYQSRSEEPKPETFKVWGPIKFAFIDAPYGEVPNLPNDHTEINHDEITPDDNY